MSAARTPLVESPALAQKLGVASVWLKMESSQPSGSFKQRGMSHLLNHLKGEGYESIVCSSGGNAGLSAAYCARQLGMTAHIVVPKTTKELMVRRIRDVGAKVDIVGENWNGADAYAREICEKDPKAAYVPPFDHPKLWEGHSPMIKEISEQLPEGDNEPLDAIVVSVGGGGLIAGVIFGLSEVGPEWANKTRVIAAETEGAASFAASLEAGELTRLEKIDTIATTLGALCVSADSLKFAQDHPAGCESQIVSDAEAVAACKFLADEHRVLVEPACGAALAAALKQKFSSEARVGVIVCGGSAVSLDLLQEWSNTFKIA